MEKLLLTYFVHIAYNLLLNRYQSFLGFYILIEKAIFV